MIYIFPFKSRSEPSQESQFPALLLLAVHQVKTKAAYEQFRFLGRAVTAIDLHAQSSAFSSVPEVTDTF